MRKVKYARSADRDLNDILSYIAHESGSRFIAEKFVKQLRAKCQKLASLPGTFGRARPELGLQLRSLAYKNYVIFFQYIEDRMEIVNVLESHRDIIGYYGDDDDLS